MKFNMEVIKEIIGMVSFIIFVIVLFVLYMAATPEQYSAECEYQRFIMEGGAE